MKQNKLYKWSFFRGSATVEPEYKVTELYLSYSLESFIDCAASLRKKLTKEREILACKALNQLGMDAFAIAGDQLPWLFVEEGQEDSALTRNNTVISLDQDGVEYSFDDPYELKELRHRMGLHVNVLAYIS